MDFTYFIASFFGLITGFVASLIFVMEKWQSIPRLVGFSLLAAAVINGLTLINWAHAAQESAQFLLIDFTLILAFSIVGCLLGMLPVLAVRTAVRWVQKTWSHSNVDT